jgi:hypothetical protein
MVHIYCGHGEVATYRLSTRLPGVRDEWIQRGRFHGPLVWQISLVKQISHITVIAIVMFPVYIVSIVSVTLLYV